MQRWQILGGREVREAPRSGGIEAVREAAARAHRELTSFPLLSKHIAVSRGGKLVESLPPAGAGEVLQCCLTLPEYVKFTAEAHQPRPSQRPGRILNQPGVRRTTAHPELLSHEGKEELPGAGSFVVYVRGRDRYMRLELGTGKPTAACVFRRVAAVLGDGRRLAFEGQELRASRQYLHRVGVRNGGVLELVDESWESGARSPPASERGAEGGAECGSPRRSPRKRAAPLLLPAGAGSSGRMWWGSSRKRRLLSTGEFGGMMGSLGTPLHEPCPEGMLSPGDDIVDPEEEGFIREQEGREGRKQLEEHQAGC